jgi:alcohol dehydrogenase (cytochrome c)
MQSRSLSIILIASAVLLGMSYAIACRQSAVSEPDGSDWLYVDHDLAGTRYSHLNQITTKNVSQLAKPCAYSFPDKEPSQTAPIVSAGIMYLTTGHYTVAVDGSDCQAIWTSKWLPRDYETFNTQRGAALAGGNTYPVETPRPIYTTKVAPAPIYTRIR